MRKESNFKIYIKEKNTKIAFIFFSLFIICFILSLLPVCYYSKGVRNDFSMEKIAFITSNNNDTTYLVSKKNNLYYSQDKSFDSSHLNKYSNIKNVSNAYGDATAHEYNFIKLNYDFPYKIIDVKGYADNVNGEKGYTLVLLDNGDLYFLSNNTKDFKLLYKNASEIYNVAENILIKDKNNNLSYIYLQENELYKIELNINNIKSAFIASSQIIDEKLKSKIYYVSQTNSLSYIYLETDNLKQKEQIDNNGIFPLYKLGVQDSVEENNLLENVKQIATIDYSCLILTYDNKLFGIDEKSLIFSNDNIITEISNDKIIDEIYSTGRYAFILKTSNNLSYIGDIKFESTKDYLTIKEINEKADYLYSSSNGSFLLKKGKLYLYHKKSSKFQGMYINYFVYYIQRYFSLFVCAMIILYFILSYIELSKRYNRYYGNGGN